MQPIGYAVLATPNTTLSYEFANRWSAATTW
jgi:hypothetical protein